MHNVAGAVAHRYRKLARCARRTLVRSRTADPRAVRSKVARHGDVQLLAWASLTRHPDPRRGRPGDEKALTMVDTCTAAVASVHPYGHRQPDESWKKRRDTMMWLGQQ